MPAEAKLTSLLAKNFGVVKTNNCSLKMIAGRTPSSEAIKRLGDKNYFIVHQLLLRSNEQKYLPRLRHRGRPDRRALEPQRLAA
jgi:hypothetical protein